MIYVYAQPTHSAVESRIKRFFKLFKYAQHIVTYRPIARQRLSKHIPVGANARNNVKSIARLRISKHAKTTRDN
jgi:hypothetical protein